MKYTIIQSCKLREGDFISPLHEGHDLFDVGEWYRVLLHHPDGRFVTESKNGRIQLFGTYVLLVGYFKVGRTDK